MEERLPAVINSISVNTEVLRDVVVKPTLINFFFGKNGTGKSTITRQFRNAEKVSWSSGHTADDFQIEIYDEDFIRESIQSYGNIPGVFTLSKGNKEKKDAIDEKTRRVREINKRKEEAIRILSDACILEKTQFDDLSKEVWNQTADLRTKYKEAYPGFRDDRRKFLKELLEARPIAHRIQDIDRLYEAAFKEELRKQPYFHLMQSAEMPECPLLEMPIYGSSSTPFAEFIKALNATSWVQHGREHYHKQANGKCPYCQQMLPATFDEDLASCFDDQYQKAVGILHAFIETYQFALNQTYAQLAENLKLEIGSPLVQTYRDKLELLRQNCQEHTV